MFILIKRILFISILIVTTNYFTNGHKTGAPPFSCKTMIPGHGARPQTSPPPYNISVIGVTAGNGEIKVKLTALINRYFTGYLLRAKLVSTEFASNNSGKFIAAPEFTILDCGGEQASGVTHNSNVKKVSVEMDWFPPKGYEGSVVFVATVVQDYLTFWTDVESLPIYIGRPARGAPYNNNIDNQLNAALLSVYAGCGQTKNCLSYPENCLRTKSCDGLVSVMADAGFYQVEMFAKNSTYVAVGFSEDASMGGDNVAECVNENNNVTAYRSWNEPNRKSNQRLEDDGEVSLVKGLYAEGAIYCKIRVDPILHGPDRKFDLNNEQYFLLLAAGRELSSGQAPGVGYHDVLYTVSNIRRYLSEVSYEPTQDSFYSGCNIIKTCFGVPEGCVERQNCQAVTSVSVQGSRFIISMLGKNAAYVATGLSEDLHMGDDIVIECLIKDNTVQSYLSWNVPNRKDNIRSVKPGWSGVEIQNGGVNNGVLQCTVAYDPKVSPSFIYDKKYYLLLAAGTSLNPDKVGYHNLVYKASAKQVSLPVTSKSDSFYLGCERTKGCFGVPEGCIKIQTCNVAVAITSDYNNRYIFYLLANTIEYKAPAYVAVGLSEDALMGDDAVLECVRDEQSNVIKPYMSWNVEGQKANRRMPENYLSLINGSYVDGKLQCAISLQSPVFTLNKKTFNLARDKYNLLLASGTTVTPSGFSSLGQVGYHDLARQAAAERRSLAEVSAIKGVSKLFLQLHGCFMIASWIGLASLGIVIARYYKQTWVDNSCFGKDIWFFWHRLFMFLTWILTIAGVILIYKYSDGFITGPGETHMLLGFVTTFLVFIQPIVATCRPSPDSSRRPIFNWFHWFVGNAAHIVAIVTIFFAVDLSKAELPKWTDYILAGFVAYYVVVHLLLSIVGCISDKSGGIRINAIQMKDMNLGRNMPQAYERQKDATYSGLRKVVLSFHFLIIAAFSVLLILLVIYAPIT